MVTVIFLLIGLAILDMILSQNRRHDRPHRPYNYRHDDPYTPSYHPPRYPYERDDFEHYVPHYRYDSPDYRHYPREQSPVVATMIFIIAVIGFLYFLAH